MIDQSEHPEDIPDSTAMCPPTGGGDSGDIGDSVYSCFFSSSSSSSSSSNSSSTSTSSSSSSTSSTSSTCCSCCCCCCINFASTSILAPRPILRVPIPWKVSRFHWRIQTNLEGSLQVGPLPVISRVKTVEVLDYSS